MEKNIDKIISEAIRKVVNEAEYKGFVVPDYFADDALSFFQKEVGFEVANKAIIKAIPKHELAKYLAIVFNNFNFTEWNDRMKSLGII